MPSTLSTPRDPRWSAALEEGRRAFDAAGYVDRPGVVSPWQPADREASARAYAQLATALPERHGRDDQALLRPRRLAPVRSCLTPEAMTDAVFAAARVSA